MGNVESEPSQSPDNPEELVDPVGPLPLSRLPQVGGCCAECRDDSVRTCWFSTWGVPDQVALSARATATVTGWDFTAADAKAVGERLVHFERAFGARFGHTAEDDLDVPIRIVAEPPAGQGVGHRMKDHLEWMVREVYRLNGWNGRTGKPLRGTLEMVWLEHVGQGFW